MLGCKVEVRGGEAAEKLRLSYTTCACRCEKLGVVAVKAAVKAAVTVEAGTSVARAAEKAVVMAVEARATVTMGEARALSRAAPWAYLWIIQEQLESNQLQSSLLTQPLRAP